MKAILAKQRNDSFSLLRYEPIVETIAGTNNKDIYVRAGDPIGFRNMCKAATSALLGTDIDLSLDSMGDSMNVEVFIIPRKNMTLELRKLIMKAQKGN